MLACALPVLSSDDKSHSGAGAMTCTRASRGILPLAIGSPLALPAPGVAPAHRSEDPSVETAESDGDTRGAESDEPDVPVEPVQVTAGRLTALPLTAQARLMAFNQALQARLANGAEGIVVARIHGDIELGIAYYLDRAVREAQDMNAILLVLDVETPGGRVDAAIMMRDYLLNSEVLTVAFVHNRAWSAGALISMANDLIVMTQGSSMGAATPIQMGGSGSAEPVEEKVVSALRAEFRATAEAQGRNADIAESMVDSDISVGGVIESGRLLTLTGREAVDLGFAEAHAESLDDLLVDLGLQGQTIRDIGQSWAESLVRVITGPMISSLLMSLGILGLLFELMTPGFGWAGAMGLTALALFFAGHLLVKLAGFEEITLFIAGLALLAVEIFVLPGFGIVGILGIVAIGASLVLSLIGLDLGHLALSAVSIREALLRVGISFVITVVGMALLFRFVPSTRMGRRLVLAQSLAQGPSLAQPATGPVQPGDVGTALTFLKPFGRGKFGHQRLEVVADGGFIEQGTPIRVVRITGQRIEVRPTHVEVSKEADEA